MDYSVGNNRCDEAVLAVERVVLTTILFVGCLSLVLYIYFSSRDSHVRPEHAEVKMRLDRIEYLLTRMAHIEDATKSRTPINHQSKDHMHQSKHHIPLRHENSSRNPKHNAQGSTQVITWCARGSTWKVQTVRKE